MMSEFSATTKQGSVEGYCDTKFIRVAESFVRNFEDRGEVGASCVVIVEGEPVVDIWGGSISKDGQAWEKDTLCTVFSSTKGAMALCAHMLVDQGHLDLDRDIVDYWPEFGAGGKHKAKVKMALDHSVGVPHIREELPEGAFYDYDYMVDRVAAEPVFWEPGSRGGYHAITMAWTVGELIHRAADQRLGAFFNEHVVQPLELDFWIGSPPEIEHRIAPMIAAEPDEAWLNTRFVKTALSGIESPTQLFMRDFLMLDPNTEECHQAEVGSANGITNARGLARMYAPLAMRGKGSNGYSVVSETTLARMGRVSMASHDDATLLVPTRFALGFMKAMDNRKVADSVNSSLIIGDTAFGHVGAGGSLGFADPECGLSFGYTMNRMGTGILMNERGQCLVDKTYKTLGYSSDASGAWIK